MPDRLRSFVYCNGEGRQVADHQLAHVLARASDQVGHIRQAHEVRRGFDQLRVRDRSLDRLYRRDDGIQGTGSLAGEVQRDATLLADANAGYDVSDVGPIFVGEIVRNGTQLQAPLVQTPNAWVSRIVLTNTGSSDRPYELSVMGESGNIIGVDSTLLVGTVPANGTKVIELDDILLTFSGSSRATINATIAAPNNQIQGLYQIVNPDSGSISNHVMVRPGTN